MAPPPPPSRSAYPFCPPLVRRSPLLYGGVKISTKESPMTPLSQPKTLYEKIWDSHVVREAPGQPAIIYIDRHLIATQCLVQSRSKKLHILVHGKRPKGVTAKDLILAIIGKIGIGGGTGHVAEYGGEAIRGLSMDGRMTVCNMTIEGGARAGMVAPDETT